MNTRRNTVQISVGGAEPGSVGAKLAGQCVCLYGNPSGNLPATRVDSLVDLVDCMHGHMIRCIAELYKNQVPLTLICNNWVSHCHRAQRSLESSAKTLQAECDEALAKISTKAKIYQRWNDKFASGMCWFLIPTAPLTDVPRGQSPRWKSTSNGRISCSMKHWQS